MAMKKQISFLFIALFAVSTTLSAQNQYGRSAVKFNATAVVGVINPSFELALNNHFSLQLEGTGIWHPNEFLNTGHPLVLTGALIEGRWYPINTFKGVYIGPNLGTATWKLSKGVYPKYKESYKNQYQFGNVILAGATVGYQLPLGKHWGIDVTWGLGWTGAMYEGHENSDGSMYVGWNGSVQWLWAYKGGVNIVYRW